MANTNGKSIIRQVVAIGIGAAIFVALTTVQIPIGFIPNTALQVRAALLAFFAAVFGPVAGFAIGLIGHALGDALFYGQGAGKLATASAIVADIVDCAKNMGKTIECRWKDEDVEYVDDSKKVFEYFIRVKKEDYGKISEVIGVKENVSIDSLGDEVGFVSEAMSEAKFFEMKKQFEGSIINYVRFL